MPFCWNWVLSKCYRASSYILNFDNSAVVGFDFGLCWHHRINKIPFLCLCCATDTNSSTCMRIAMLTFWTVVLVWSERVWHCVCSSVSNAVPSSCLSNLCTLWHTLAICPFLLHLEHTLSTNTFFCVALSY